MLTNGQYAYQNHNNNLHLVAVFSLSRFLFVFLPPSVPEQNLVRLMALVFFYRSDVRLSPNYQRVKALMETQTIIPSSSTIRMLMEGHSPLLSPTPVTMQ